MNDAKQTLENLGYSVTAYMRDNLKICITNQTANIAIVLENKQFHIRSLIAGGSVDVPFEVMEAVFVFMQNL